MKKLLIIGRTFPEPSTTAAGRRMMDLIDYFLSEDYQITFSSTASKSERSANLSKLGVMEKDIFLNDPSFDQFITQLQPNIVLFDRFITEEQFGWRIAEILPSALKILDTEDVHFLRKAREEAHQKQIDFKPEHLYSDLAKREIASILRSDLTLIISEYELELLIKQFQIPKEILCYLPFLVEAKRKMARKSFDERRHFISVGNFYHKPNKDSVIFLRKEIWPLIREALPEAEIHIYGAYAPQQIIEMHHPQSGFRVLGWTKNLLKKMEEARVCLAPLRFGAGLKGKLLEAMLCKTPVITTPVGAEGMYGSYNAPGFISSTPKEIIKSAITLYSDSTIWLSKSNPSIDILNHRYNKSKHLSVLKMRVEKIIGDINGHRNSNFIGQILQHHMLNTSKYLSKWIEEKNRI